jgi:hypothetical protein
MYERLIEGWTHAARERGWKLSLERVPIVSSWGEPWPEGRAPEWAPKLVGAVEGVSFEVDTLTNRSAIFARVCFAARRGLPTFQIVRAPDASGAEVDPWFKVETDDQAAMSALLTPELRDQLKGFPAMSLFFGCDRQRVEIRWPAVGPQVRWMMDATSLRALDAALEIALVVLRPDDRGGPYR